ncbi:MAG TPA: hypothetical protein VKU02_27740 [Gemmataceae bacterium]|nr:hypothetical protein [Gemmataceae bacterium]
MNRTLVTVLLATALIGCQLPPERVPLKPLPEDGPPPAYADLVSRARAQATAATEAFYINNWPDLEDAAKGMEVTARVLSKATDVPANHKTTLPAEAGALGADAVKLREAAKAQDVRQTTDVLQRINLKVRELRPQE